MNRQGNMTWLADQLAQIARSQVQRETVYNPNPPGTIHEGSATDAVLLVLKANAPRFMSFAAIKAATGRNGKSVGWAVWYLRSLGKVEARAAGDRRSPLYQLYRVKQEATNE